MSRLTTAASFDMLARGKALEAQGRSIIHLGIGEPDFDTPAFIRDAATAALAAGYTHYGPAAGLPEFRKLIAATWRARRGIACDAANVVVTPGAKPVLFFTMLATLEPGDEVLIPSPAFPTYASVAEFVGARVVPVPLVPARGFDGDLGALAARITSRRRTIPPAASSRPPRSPPSPSSRASTTCW
jgi:aspartate/methionine/tyrosine aminotransferase